MQSLALLLLLHVAAPADEPRADRVLWDFEDASYDGWQVEGEAFGAEPATGSLERQQPVSGFLGRRLANSFAGSDDPQGRMTSEVFELDRRCLRFYVGGGEVDVGVRLEVQGEVVFEATGARSELLRPVVWNLSPYQGREARLVVFDDASGSWGHVLADAFTLTDDGSGGPPLSVGPRVRVYDPRAGEELPYSLNDHCFVRADDGTWHVFAISFTEPGTPEIDGRLFAHLTARDLLGPWAKEARTLELDPEAGETRLWAPHVVRADRQWHMLYHAGGADERRSRIHLARSRDLMKWKRERENPVVVDGFQARDPFLLEHDGRWHLYYTATFPSAGGHHTVALRTSDDLVEWSAPHDAYRDPAIGTDFGRTESPFVVQRGPWWYLFVGSSEPRTYDDTRVFRSRDPRNWAPADHVATLRVHGAEVVRAEDGRWYASHAGDGRGGLWLARLYWNDGLDDDGRPFE